MKHKYAIIPINIKKVDGLLYLRSVLIRYSRKKQGVYEGSKYIGCSPYFNDSSRALQYKFEDNGYTLVSDAHGISKELIMVKRTYHTNLYQPSFEFKAKADSDAFEEFRSGKYFDCDSNPIKDMQDEEDAE